jgi:uncharacterized protein (DUF2147 family)
MKQRVLPAIAIALVAVFGISAALSTLWKGDDLLGEWYTAENKVLVKIYKNKSDYYFGKIVWMKNPKETNGKEKLDKENPDPKLRDQPLMGLLLLKSFKFEDDKWVGGTIYDPENGKTYKCTIRMDNKQTIQVRGYIGVSAIGRTTTWIRKAD